MVFKLKFGLLRQLTKKLFIETEKKIEKDQKKEEGITNLTSVLRKKEMKKMMVLA